jgi:hypothetical protein
MGRSVGDLAMGKLRELNTLRNQIFAGFTLTMIVVLVFAGVFIYGQVSALLRNSAEKHIQQTAVQANGRLDALLDQIYSLSTQVATDATVQRLLLKEASGRRPTSTNARRCSRSSAATGPIRPASSRSSCIRRTARACSRSTTSAWRAASRRTGSAGRIG